MTTKKSRPDVEQVRISVSLTADSVVAMDEAVSGEGSHPVQRMQRYPRSRSALLQRLLDVHLASMSVRPRDRKEGHEVLLKESGTLKLRSTVLSAEGAPARDVSTLTLLAAAREIEALSLLSDDQRASSYHVTEALFLIKEALGLRSLPELPKRR
jgi:hypothetical protein